MKMSLEEDCKRLLGLPPYDSSENPVRGDSYFRAALCTAFGDTKVDNMVAELTIHKTSYSKEESREAIRARLGRLQKSPVIGGPKMTRGSSRLRMVIPAKRQKEIDQFVDAYHQLKRAKEEYLECRDTLKEFMESKGLQSVESSAGDLIYRTGQFRPKITSRYTRYPIDVIKDIVPDTFHRKCIVEVVDSDALEELIDRGHLPRAIRECREGVVTQYIYVEECARNG